MSSNILPIYRGKTVEGIARLLGVSDLDDTTWMDEPFKSEDTGVRFFNVLAWLQNSEWLVWKVIAVLAILAL